MADVELLGAGEYFAGRVGPEENFAGGVGPADENLAVDVDPEENLADGGVGPAENLADGGVGPAECLAAGRGERATEPMLLLTGFLIGTEGEVNPRAHAHTWAIIITIVITVIRLMTPGTRKPGDIYDNS